MFIINTSALIESLDMVAEPSNYGFELSLESMYDAFTEMTKEAASLLHLEFMMEAIALPAPGKVSEKEKESRLNAFWEGLKQRAKQIVAIARELYGKFKTWVTELIQSDEAFVREFADRLKINELDDSFTFTAPKYNYDDLIKIIFSYDTKKRKDVAQKLIDNISKADSVEMLHIVVKKMEEDISNSKSQLEDLEERMTQTFVIQSKGPSSAKDIPSTIIDDIKNTKTEKEILDNVDITIKYIEISINRMLNDAKKSMYTDDEKLTSAKRSAYVAAVNMLDYDNRRTLKLIVVAQKLLSARRTTYRQIVRAAVAHIEKTKKPEDDKK